MHVLKIRVAGIKPLLLGAIHSLVSTVYKGFHLITVIGIKGHSDAGRDEDFVAVRDKGILDAFQNIQSNNGCIFQMIYLVQVVRAG